MIIAICPQLRAYRIPRLKNSRQNNLKDDNYKKNSTYNEIIVFLKYVVASVIL